MLPYFLESRSQKSEKNKILSMFVMENVSVKWKLSLLTLQIAERHTCLL